MNLDRSVSDLNEEDDASQNKLLSGREIFGGPMPQGK